ncbi:hypothetical protein DFP72DRAFT_239983 [Ephemerocybe angulata]|uniref:F-box domain-containing protein n=1 Tax=Ephemerocybe angulata TaxID=980116 RepID=A0A8H6LT58_9AGAR|nr:hypothetical protein DFP72DRAFT_239983 [Tulosesus angulatus]
MRIGNGILPPEVLGDVFNNTLPDTPNVFSRKRLIELCLVCKDWRDAAHSDGRLWSGINLEFTSQTQVFSYRKVLAWLDRSRGRPKRLAVVAAGRTINCAETSLCSASNPALAQFLLQVPALDHLHLEFRTSRCFKNLCSSMKSLSEGHELAPRSLDSSSFPVNSLSLKVAYFTHDDRTNPKHIFNSLPGVSALQLNFPATNTGRSTAIFLPPIASLFSPSILQPITNLSIGCNWPFRDIAVLLNSCVNIEELAVDLRGFEDGVNLLPRKQVSLPKVRVLRLRGIIPLSLKSLDFLKLRAISEFDVQFGHRGMILQILEIYHTESWEKFLWRHAETLRILRIEDLKVPEEHLLSMIPTKLPMLEELHLNRVYFNADIFDYWTPTLPSEVEGSMWFPRLKTLEVLHLPPEFDSKKVLTFLRTRRSHHEESTRKEEQGVVRGVFRSPPDSMQRLVLTYERWVSQRMGKIQEYSGEILELSAVLRRAGILVNMGPKYVGR